MLISTAQMKELFCKFEKVNKSKVKVEVCKYPQGYTFDQYLYAGYLGLVLSIIFLLLHLAIYILNTKIGQDFVKCYITATTIPLSFGVGFRIIQIILGICMPRTPSFWIDFFAHAHTVCLSAAFATAVLGIICFLYSHAFVMCTGIPPDVEESWSMFLTAQLIGWLLSGLYHLTSPEYRKMVNFVMVAVMYIGDSVVTVAIVSALCSACCCRPKKREASDPVVANATVRLLWAVVSALTMIPCGLALRYYTWEAGNYADNFDEKAYIDNYFQYRILEFFAGPYMVLSALLLPTYRNAILVFLGKKENPKWAVKVGTSGAPLINQQMHATEIA